MDGEALIHLVGGALGGTAGAALTCPLEVVKTRLQSSDYVDSTGSPSTSTSNRCSVSFRSAKSLYRCRQHQCSLNQVALHCKRNILPSPFRRGISNSQFLESANRSFGKGPRIFQIFRHIISKEGFGALYKGLAPNLVGVAPAKAVYFYAYSSSKRFLNDVDIFVPNSAMVHMVSAALAGFVSATAANPIWMIKTRLQLHKGPLNVGECISRIFSQEGIPGFYRGVTASYVGISETVIQFVIYEHIRSWLLQSKLSNSNSGHRNTTDFMNFMVAGGAAKFFACVIAYPHEVIRTRLREENRRAKGFFSTLRSVYRGEGVLALYRGLAVQIMRTVPNTAITMGTYELVVHLLHRLYIS